MKYLFMFIWFSVFFSYYACSQKSIFKGETNFQIENKDTLFFSPTYKKADFQKLDKNDVLFILNIHHGLFTDFMIDSSNVFARNKFEIGNTHKAYIITYWSENKRENRTYLHIYNKETKEIEPLNNILLAESFGSEGAEGISNAWIMDFNNDGDRDLVIRKKERFSSLKNNGDELVVEYDKLTILLWDRFMYMESYVDLKKINNVIDLEKIPKLKSRFNFFNF